MRTWRLLAAIGLLVILVGTIAVTAQARVDRNVQALIDRLERIDKLLLKADWARARRQSDALIRDLKSVLVYRGSALVGAALVQRGVALEATGQRDDALWDVFAADTFSGRTRAQLAQYGEHGAALLEVLTDEPDEPTLDVVVETGLGLVAVASGATEDEESRATRGTLAIGGFVSPPVKRSGRQPEYPEGLRQAAIEDLVIVQVVLDKHGRPGQPQIVRGGAHPALALVALEAMKEWRFTPAQLHGEPVDVHYTLSVNFSLRR